MRLRTPTLIAVSLALAAGGTAPVLAQTYRMLTSRARDPGELRLWEVTASGELTQLDFQTTGEVDAAFRFRVDPFGRFMVYPVFAGPGLAFDIYELSPTDSPEFRERYSRPGWDFFGHLHCISADGRFLFAASRHNLATPEWFYEALGVENDLTLQELEGKQFLPPETRSTLGFTSVGCAQVPGLGYVFISTARVSDGFVNVFPVTASGEFLGHAQQFEWQLVQPLNADVVARQDQRVVVAGPMGWDRLTSFAVSPEGRLAIIDAYDFFEFGPLGPAELFFHPSGLSLLSGGFPQSIPMTRAGGFPEPAFFGPGDGSDTMAVSPDGRIGVAIWDVDAQGIHWGVFALTPTGGLELIRDHVFPFGYRDIAFIPPRTEEVLGDANADARRDAADIVTYLNHFNDPATYPEWHPLSPRIRGPVPEARADADQDGQITITDLDWLIDFLLGDSTM